MVGLQILDLPIGVRVPVSQPNSFLFSLSLCSFSLQNGFSFA